MIENGISLREHLVVILEAHARDHGIPMRLRVIRRRLRERGVIASESAVIQTLKRDPERFERVSWGLYSMKGVR